jgi:hypothetical protein
VEKILNKLQITALFQKLDNGTNKVEKLTSLTNLKQRYRTGEEEEELQRLSI